MKRSETYHYFCPQHSVEIWGNSVKQLYMKLVLHLQAKHGLDENRSRINAKDRLGITPEDLV